MKEVIIPIEELESALKYAGVHDRDLIKRMKKYGWEGIIPIPVTEVPEHLMIGGKKYYHSDGHRRHSCAIDAGLTHVRGIQYDANDDPNEISKITGEATLRKYEDILITLEEA